MTQRRAHYSADDDATAAIVRANAFAANCENMRLREQNLELLKRCHTAEATVMRLLELLRRQQEPWERLGMTRDDWSFWSGCLGKLED